MKSIYELLDELRASSLSKVEQGTKFERLMKAFLTTDPVYAEQFKEVWLWAEWPGNGGKHDTGVDLVALDRLTGLYVAVQCKFYDPDHTISKDDVDTFLSASGKVGFVERIFVSTTDRWNRNAEDAIKAQQIPVRRIGVSDLEASPIDWSQFDFATPEVLVTVGKKVARPHQVTAISKVVEGFAEHDRGRLIMACGTGKTFTALRLAEQQVGAGGSVLFLVPSISLLSQTLREWVVESNVPLTSLAVCSDRKSTARSKNTDEDIATVDLALPATTKVDTLVERLHTAEADPESMTVVFSTYQSIEAVQRAQAAAGSGPFDLIVCDEAHRTTGVTLIDDEDESPFVKVHDADFIKGSKRLYMTATPRIFDDATKTKAGEREAVLASMDDPRLFGPEFHRLGFGEAVENDLLTDYKVLVLVVDETAVAKTFQSQLSDDGELRLGDAAKIVGCWNGLAKKGHAEHDFGSDPAPMCRAVAFAGTIAASKKIENLFGAIVEQYIDARDLAEDGDDPLNCEVRHVDGTYNALERNARLDWLRANVPDGSCRILTNARCLSEGVDVPALDAVMFLSPRKSVVDVVQSVGRVMRKAPGKRFGYIILPIGIPADTAPEVALRDNARYQVVWEVLQALRAHDDRFNAEVNKIDLTKTRSERINVIGVGGGEPSKPGEGQVAQQALNLSIQQLDEWRDAVYAKIVSKVGSRRYWEDWAKDVAQIAERHITRITALLDDNRTGVGEAFDQFLSGLRANLNEGITQTDAIEMLAQHLITRPVFEALFAGYDFAAHNPVAQVMENMLEVLDEHSLGAENETLERFYESVRMRVDGINTADGRQRIVVELYDTFFSTAFKRTVDKLGIVYTPVEIVDFILRSADDVLRQEFGQGLTDENVHVLDGFVGTGTFIVRLIQSGLIAATDLLRKYKHELHANEILLLAYYIAAVNIESAYLDARIEDGGAESSTEFPGLILTDTFQSWEEGDQLNFEVFRENNERLKKLKQLPITVIVGNPPYSSGQDSANDNNANEEYAGLDESIRATYAARSTATLKNSLYDSYIRAIRWASLRIANRGVIAFVTNGGWLDSNAADGMRKTLAEEFSSIYVYNLRGNQRTAGEQSRKEGGKVFGGGSRATVAITVLVKNPAANGTATIRYADIGDYLSREAKLERIAATPSVLELSSSAIAPNEHGDWINQRSREFDKLVPIAKTERPGIFRIRSSGVKTNRDAWVYNFGTEQLTSAALGTIAAYNKVVGSGRAQPSDEDKAGVAWSDGTKSDLKRGRIYEYVPGAVSIACYRPFVKERIYLDEQLIERPGLVRRYFPTSTHPNMGFYTLAPGSPTNFSVFMVDHVPEHVLFGAGNPGQFFARWSYDPVATEGGLDLGVNVSNDGYKRTDNITNDALRMFRIAYGESITKDDIFFYVYGLLHSAEYRETYAADLKKMLPRVPLVVDPWPFIESGQALSELHLGYETVEPYPLDGLDVEPVGDPYDFFRVVKMAFAKVTEKGKKVADKSTIRYNSKVIVSGIPDEAHRYMLGSRSAVEWIIDRYQVRTDKASGIVNDPNDWSREVGDPRYILDALARVVTVSVETVGIVESLPGLDAVVPLSRQAY
jgi:predicted helicase